ncbi:Transmembrane protein [Entamoeba marina]
MSDSSSTTSLKLPVRVEAVVATLCLFTSIFVYFFEQANVYCRALALQNIITFLWSFHYLVPIGGAFEWICIAFLIVLVIIKVIMIALAVIGGKSEKLISIPPISTFILKRASAV